MGLRLEIICLCYCTYMEVCKYQLEFNAFDGHAKTDYETGGFITGSKDGVLSQPGGMILESIDNGHPIMHVEINYRLNGQI